MSLNITIGTPFAAELQDAIHHKCVEFEYTPPDDQVLSEFVTVMIANRKTKGAVDKELEEVVGPEYNHAFSDWLFQYVELLGTQQQSNGLVTVTKKELPPTREPEKVVVRSQIIAGELRKNTDVNLNDTDLEMGENVRGMEAPRRRDVTGGPNARMFQAAMNGANRDAKVASARTGMTKSSFRINEQSTDSNSPSPPREPRAMRERRELRDRLGARDRSRSRSPSRMSVLSRLGGRVNERPMNVDMRLGLRVGSTPIGNPLFPLAGNSFQPQTIHMNPAFLAAQMGQSLIPAPNNTYDGDDAIVLTGNIQRCNHWQQCSLGDACKFWHPKEICRAWPNCPNSVNTCLYIHPEENPKAVTNNGNDNPQATKVPCRFYPNCTNPNCTFFHPSNTNSVTPSPVIHEQEILSPNNKVPVPCRDGAACVRVGCHFLHPWDNKVNPIPCKFGAACTRPDCVFQHPPMTFHRNKTLVLNSNTPHITERKFAVADDDVVERVPVAANGAIDQEGDVDMN